MKKIGIVTLNGYTNYGNRLQNYALLYTLNKLGFETQTCIFIDKKNESTKSCNQIIKRLSKLSIYKIKSQIKSLVQKVRKDRSTIYIESNRIEIFKSFSSEYLNERIIDFSNIESKSVINSIDYFITGSDQVWHPNQFNNLPKYFLTFTEYSKRLSYAPSFSVNNIPEKYQNKYSEWLHGMSALSVREEQGAKIIKDITGLDSTVVVDPTMLLNKDDWLKISKKAKNRPSESYILTYFLGGAPANVREKINDLAITNKMKIINLADKKEELTYQSGPSEFIDYISNSSLFLTDSFHGVVFSIVFEKPFVVYERLTEGASMYSRIETILDTFNMRNREAEGFNGNYFEMEFTGSRKILQREYNKSISYLKSALFIEG